MQLSRCCVSPSSWARLIFYEPHIYIGGEDVPCALLTTDINFGDSAIISKVVTVVGNDELFSVLTFLLSGRRCMNSAKY